MRQRLRSSLTYANVMATLAVFLVLGGGTALGAFVVSSNSQIGPGTVSGHKPPTGDHPNIIAGSVNGQDVGLDSLGGARINESTLGLVPNADKLDGIDSSGFLGANAKAADADLLDGKDSTQFLSHDLVLSTADVTVNPGFGTSSTVNCPGGRVALGGGVGFIDGSGNPSFHAGSPVVLSRPKPDLDGWIAGMTNNLITPQTMRLYVICAA